MDFKTGVINGRQLFNHQVHGAEWLLMHTRGLLHGDPGVGKTAEAVKALQVVKPAKAAIFAPLSTLTHWQRELWQWGGLTSRIVRDAADVAHGRILILNPDKLHKPAILTALRAQHFDALVLDECQQFKNPEAKRTRYIYGKGNGLVHRTDRVWLLSGTPYPQGPVDLFVPLRVLFPGVLQGMNRDAFIERYHVLDADRVRILGTRNMNELASRLQPHLLRQPVDECDLPPLRFGVMPLGRDVLEWDQEAYDRAIAAAGLDGWDDLTETDFETLIYEQRLHLSTLRALLARAKAARIADMAAEELASGRGKLVIFSWHLDAIQRIYAHLKAFGAVTLTGATSERNRTFAVDRFQQMSSCRVLIAQGDAGGLGITLHAASECWFVDCPWTPSSLLQAAKRLHRIGQKHPVLARVFTVDDSVDDAVIGTLLRKSRMISSLQPDAAEGALTNAL